MKSDTMTLQSYGIEEALKSLGIKETNPGAGTGTRWSSSNGKVLDSYSPVDGRKIASVHEATPEDYEAAMKSASEAFKTWRAMPAPKRGEIVRQIGDE
ncbi:MAG: hypothetical protein RL213_1922, partial [Bacteroidota bacterium]